MHCHAVDYETVTKTKWEYVSEVYQRQVKNSFSFQRYKDYFERNKHWLVPYAAFVTCAINTARLISANGRPIKNLMQRCCCRIKDSASAFSDIALHYFIQYQLHLQLKEATAYAHANGVIVKGDIAIGVYRHGADAWQSPECTIWISRQERRRMILQ
jgi:4-alpha-glucanotransferase